MKTPGHVLAKQVKQIEESRIFDVRSEELPTWCPGCGYFGIHQGLNNAIQQLGIPHHEVVTVSGIGCAGRYPFFTNTYGLHTVHGRALPVSTGVKMANPKLTVFAVGGDGDGLAMIIPFMASPKGNLLPAPLRGSKRKPLLTAVKTLLSMPRF